MGVRRPQKITRPAVFLDRDGTLIRQVNDIVDFSQVRILKGTAEGIKLFNRLGYLVVVITNQPVIGKGLVTKKKVEAIHKTLATKFKKKGAVIDAFYLCPHLHADDCTCRKPKLGMVNAAVKKYDIDIKKSFFIGDDRRDIETGKRAKMQTILLKTGKAGRDKKYFDAEPDATAANLLSAAKRIARLRK